MPDTTNIIRNIIEPWWDHQDYGPKYFQHKLGYRSINSVYHLRNEGCAHINWTREFFRSMATPIAHFGGAVLLEGHPVSVVSRERCDGTLPPGLRAVGLTEGAATFTRKLFEGLSDNHLTTAEFDALKLEYEGQQRGWAMLWDAIEKRKPRAA
jgi:hypothetical protein